MTAKCTLPFSLSEKITDLRLYYGKFCEDDFKKGDEFTSLHISCLGFFAVCSEEEQDRIKAIEILDKYLQYLETNSIPHINFYYGVDSPCIDTQTFNVYVSLLKNIVMNYDKNNINEYYQTLEKFLEENVKNNFDCCGFSE